MTFKEIVEELPLLTAGERKELMLILESFLDIERYDLLDFAGFAAELYDGTDAQDYVNQMRDEWDERG